MSTDTFSLESWLDELDLTPEEKAALLPTLSKDTTKAKLRASVLRQSDYSRQSDALKAEIQREKDQLALDKAAVEEARNANVNWRGEEEGALKAAVQRAQVSEGRLLKLQQKLRDEFRVSDETLKELELDKDPLATLPPINRQEDTNKPSYLTREQWETEQNKRDLFNLSLVNQQARIYRQHVKLFGTDEGFDEDAIVKYALDNKLPNLNAAWEQMHKVADKREEIRAADEQKRIDAAVVTAKAQWESEQVLREQRNLTAFQDGFKDPAVPEWQQSFKRVTGDKAQITNDLPAPEHQHQSRVDRALAVSARIRAGEIPIVPVAGA